MRSHQPPRTQPSRFGGDEMTCTIVGSDERTGRIMVRDPYGREIEVDGTVRAKGSGFPLYGERWVLERHGNVWVPAYMVGAPTPRTITGDRTGMHPVTQQVLEALIELGLVYDATTPEEITPDPEEPGPTLPDEEIDEHDEVEPDVNPEPDPDWVDEVDDEDDTSPSRLYDTLRIGTYNIWHVNSNTNTRSDLKRLTDSNVQIWGLQEMGGDERDVLLDELDTKGWNSSRRKDGSNRGELAIVWRADLFAFVAEGDNQFHAYSASPHVPAKWGQWVRLRHRDSGQIITIINVHLLAHIDRAGHPKSDPGNLVRLNHYFDDLEQLAGMVTTHAKKGLVFVVGDFNVHWFTDSRVRNPNFPIVQMGRVGAKASYKDFAQPPIGTHGYRAIDHVWKGPHPDWRVQFTKHRILTGLHSDHRAYWAAARVKRVDQR